MIVDYSFYSTVYMGTEADEASFPALCARAEDIVGAMTRWIDPGTLTGNTLTLYKKAICAQADSLAVNGTDSLSADAGRGFTVGKVSVSGKSGSEIVTKGALSGSIAPLALMYLEQSGLMAPQVPTGPDMPLVGWGWF